MWPFKKQNSDQKPETEHGKDDADKLSAHLDDTLVSIRELRKRLESKRTAKQPELATG